MMKVHSRLLGKMACASALSLAVLAGTLVVKKPATQVQAAYSAVNQYISSHNLTYSGITYETSTFTDDFPYENGKPEGIVIHETADPGATAQDEATYFRNNWATIYAYVHAFVDAGHVIQIHPTNRGVWGAGPYANAKFIQIELCEEPTLDLFARSVNNDAIYVATLLHQYGLKPKLADDNAGSGTIWSHNAVTKYLGGTDHTDPIDYFSKWGYSMDQFFDLVESYYNGNTQPPSNGDKGAGTIVNTGSPAAHIEYNGSIAVWQTPNGHVTGKYLAHGTNWQVKGKAQVDGAWWYNLGGNQWVPGKYVSVTGFSSMPTITVPDPNPTPDPAPKAGSIVKTGSPIAQVAVTSASVYATPNGSKTSQTLKLKSKWKILEKTQVAGVWWYNVGTSQWVKGSDVAVTGFDNVKTVTAPSDSNTVTLSAIGRVNYIPGYGIMIWREPGKGSLGRYLPTGSRWKVFKKTTLSNGSVWYNLGGDQWIDGKYLVLEN